MTEHPGYFQPLDAGAPPLYGVYHATPISTALRTPVVIAPPLFDERRSAYPALVSLARKLAEQGHPVLRFDFRGSGESPGDPAARTWADLQADLRSAQAALLKMNSAAAQKKCVLLGLRLSATLCLQASATSDSLSGVIALAPVVKGATLERQWRLRSKIRADWNADQKQAAASAATLPEGTLDLDGFPVGTKFMDDVKKLDLLGAPLVARVPTNNLQLSFRTEASPESQALRTHLGKQALLDCLRLEPFWERLEPIETSELEKLILEKLDSLA